jgi:hypothetical protein
MKVPTAGARDQRLRFFFFFFFFFLPNCREALGTFNQEL